MKNLIAVAVLTIGQFTAFPLFAMVAANMERHSEEQFISSSQPSPSSGPAE